MKTTFITTKEAIRDNLKKGTNPYRLAKWESELNAKDFVANLAKNSDFKDSFSFDGKTVVYNEHMYWTDSAHVGRMNQRPTSDGSLLTFSAMKKDLEYFFANEKVQEAMDDAVIEYVDGKILLNSADGRTDSLILKKEGSEHAYLVRCGWSWVEVVTILYTTEGWEKNKSNCSKRVVIK